MDTIRSITLVRQVILIIGFINPSNLGLAETYLKSEVELETLQHLFRDCEITQHIWMGTDLGIRSNNGTKAPIADWIVIWIHVLRSYYKEETLVVKFLATLWSIWCTRNDGIFSNAAR